MMLGLRKFSIRESIRKNFRFIAGIFSELGIALAIVTFAILISFLLIYFKP